MFYILWASYQVIKTCKQLKIAFKHILSFNMSASLNQNVEALNNHPYRPAWYVPDQGKNYTILDS